MSGRAPAGEPPPAFVGSRRHLPGGLDAGGRPSGSRRWSGAAGGGADAGDLSAAVASANAAWEEDRHARAVQLYVEVLEAAGAAGDAPGSLDRRDHLQCHANLGSSYMALAAERDPPGAAPDVERRAALLEASLRHWQVAERNGPGSPVLSYFLSSVSRDLGLASEAVRLAREELGGTAAAPQGRGLEVEPVERRAASELTYEEFVARYLQPGVPVVITGSPAPSWNLDLLEELCGDVEVPRLRHEPATAGDGWAALGAAERATLGQHLRGLREAAAAGDPAAPMLFDHAIAEVCPQLLEGLVVPRYFAVDYLRAIPREEREGIWPAPERFPSLFVQPPGTRCGLHVDQAGTHFYQMLLSGKKRWRVFSKEDAPRLYPRGNGLLFEADAFEPDLDRFPLLGTARFREAVLEPGDAIFVPQGAPHQVRNEELSLAISSNYVAGAGLDVALAELELLAQGGYRPEYARAAEALRKWAPAPGAQLQREDPGDLPWRDFDAAAWLAGGGGEATGG